MATHSPSPQVPHVTVGDRLRRLRLEQHLNQDEMGDKLGISGATIGKYELAPKPPRPRVLRNLLKLAYGEEVAEWVMSGVANTPTRDYEMEASRQRFRLRRQGRRLHRPRVAA